MVFVNVFAAVETPFVRCRKRSVSLDEEKAEAEQKRSKYKTRQDE